MTPRMDREAGTQQGQKRVKKIEKIKKGLKKNNNTELSSTNQNSATCPLKAHETGHLGGSMVERPPWAQGVILGS